MRETGTYAIACTSFPGKRRGLDDNPRVLVLRFDDVLDPRNEHAFTPELAARIHRFVDAAMAAEVPARRIICACDGGVSRSVAVAAALMGYFGMDGASAWAVRSGRPNGLVHRLLMEEFGLD